jgi:hypothetical protein
MTPQQTATIKAYILATPALAALTSGPGTDYGLIAEMLSATASPTFTVWKSRVTITQIGDNINGAELAGLSSLNATRLQTVVVLSNEGVNPALADRRAFFDDIFGGAGGATTRTQLAALWRRLATLVEKVLATGTGTDVTPATLGYEGGISLGEVAAMFNV